MKQISTYNKTYSRSWLAKNIDKSVFWIQNSWRFY